MKLNVQYCYSLRVQALLYLRMFKMYNREVKEYNKIVTEYQQKVCRSVIFGCTHKNLK